MMAAIQSLLSWQGSAPHPMDDAWARGFEILLGSPHLAVSLFFLYLCGVVISFLLFQTNPKFEKQAAITSGYKFNLALGFLPGSIVMTLYSFVEHGAFPPTLDHLSGAAIPSALILAGLTFLFVLIKAFTR